MIDEKKIEEAIHGFISSHKQFGLSVEINAACDGFNAGAHWAIEQFLNDLWHDSKEMPEERRPIVYLSRIWDEDYIFTLKDNINSWEEKVMSHGIEKWCYLDDLLLKK